MEEENDKNITKSKKETKNSKSKKISNDIKDKKISQSNVNEISAIVKKALHCKDQKDEKNMIKYCDMAFEKDRYDLSIVIVNYYYISDMDDKKFIKCKNTIEKYFNIFIDNFDSEKYEGCYMGGAINACGSLSIRLYDMGNYDSMKKIALFGAKVLDNTYCMSVLGRYYKNIEKNYDEMKKYLWCLISRERGKYIKCFDDFTEKIVFERAFNDLEDYYWKKEIDYEKFKNLIFSTTINLDDDAGRIFDLIKYYNSKCCKDKKSGKKDEDDILIDFTEFLIKELSNTTINKNDKNTERIVKFLVEHCGEELNFVDAIHQLAEHYGELGEIDSMKKYYELAIEKENYEQSLHNLADHYEMIDDNDSAIKYYKICIDKNNCDTCLDRVTDILFQEKRYDELFVYENIAKSCPIFYYSLLNIGNGYCKKKNYNKMLECYSGIHDVKHEFHIRMYDISRIKIAKYYETIGKDFEKAQKYYNMVVKKHRAHKYIANFGKKYAIYEKVCKNMIFGDSDCCICCAEKNSFIKLECCSNIICVNCVMGIVGKNFMCPFCRKEYGFDYEYDDDDILVSDDDEEGRNFINGIYYRDETESESEHEGNEGEDETESESEQLENGAV